MFDRIEILAQAQAMAAHAGARQSVIAANIANADTPGYRPADLQPFAAAYRDASAGAALRQTRPGHLAAAGPSVVAERVHRAAPGDASPNGNGVSLETEMVMSAEVRAQHDMALSIYRSALGLLRASLGPGR